MTGYPKLDRHALHEYLWKESGRRHTLRVQGTHLAEKLGVSQFTVSRVMHELADAGRIKKIARAKFAVATYLIKDPADFSPEDI